MINFRGETRAPALTPRRTRGETRALALPLAATRRGMSKHCPLSPRIVVAGLRTEPQRKPRTPAPKASPEHKEDRKSSDRFHETRPRCATSEAALFYGSRQRVLRTGRRCWTVAHGATPRPRCFLLCVGPARRAGPVRLGKPDLQILLNAIFGISLGARASPPRRLPRARLTLVPAPRPR